MDIFFEDEALLEKLKLHYKTHGKIIIAYDFDDCLHESYMATDCSMVRQILRDFREYAVFICFTANLNPLKVREYIKEHNIPLDAFNENVDFMKGKYDGLGKIYFNILLDDKAGLGQAYRILNKFLNYLKESEIN